jgi:hypothetical protein
MMLYAQKTTTNERNERDTGTSNQLLGHLLTLASLWDRKNQTPDSPSIMLAIRTLLTATSFSTSYVSLSEAVIRNNEFDSVDVKINKTI